MTPTTALAAYDSGEVISDKLYTPKNAPILGRWGKAHFASTWSHMSTAENKFQADRWQQPVLHTQGQPRHKKTRYELVSHMLIEAFLDTMLSR